MGQSDGQSGQGEFFAEDVKSAAPRPPADHKIDETQAEEDGPQGADVGRPDTELDRYVQGNEQENGAGQPHGSYPEGDGQHKHQTYDIQGAEAPGRVQTVPHRAASEQGSEIITDHAADKGHHAHPGHAEFFVNGLERQPVVAHQDRIIKDHEPEGKRKVRGGYLA